MTTDTARPLTLGTRYASEFPELGVPWKAAEASGPRLLVLNDALVDELGLDADYLRGEEGVRVLTGTHVPDGATPVARPMPATSSAGTRPGSATGGPC